MRLESTIGVFSNASLSLPPPRSIARHLPRQREVDRRTAPVCRTFSTRCGQVRREGQDPPLQWIGYGGKAAFDGVFERTGGTKGYFSAEKKCIFLSGKIQNIVFRAYFSSKYIKKSFIFKQELTVTK